VHRAVGPVSYQRRPPSQWPHRQDRPAEGPGGGRHGPPPDHRRWRWRCSTGSR